MIRVRGVVAMAVAVGVSMARTGGAGAQGRRLRVVLSESRATAVDQADRLLDAGDVRRSFDLLTAQLVLEPGDFEARWRAARAAVYLGIIAPDADTEVGWYRIAVAQGDTALSARPDDQNALRWAVASKGRLAMRSGARERVQLAEDVWHLDRHLLGLFPEDALAHDILGTLNYEVMNLSALKRMLGRVFMGGDLLEAANWRDALEQQSEAVALDSTNVLFRLDLANTLAELGHVDEAEAQLEIAASLPQRLAVDGVFKARAAQRLAGLRRRNARRKDAPQGANRGRTRTATSPGLPSLLKSNP